METLKEFAAWISKTRLAFEEIHHFSIKLEEYRYQNETKKNCELLEDEKSAFLKTLQTLIDEVKEFKIDAIEGLESEALKDRYWLILFSLLTYQSDIISMLEVKWTLESLSERFDILVTKLKANLRIKQFDNVELDDGNEEALGDERSAHLIIFLMHMYLHAGTCKYYEKDLDDASKFMQEIDRLYKNRAEKPVPYLYPLDLFELDGSLMTLESMLDHVQQPGKQEPNDQPPKFRPSNGEMLEKMYSLSIHLDLKAIDEIEDYNETRSAITDLQRLILMREHAHLSDINLRVLDHIQWATICIRFMLNMLVYERINEALHAYCCAWVVFNDTDEELKGQNEWNQTLAGINHSGMKLCLSLFKKSTNDPEIACSEHLIDDPRVGEMQSKTLPFPVNKQEQAKLVFGHAMRLFESSKQLLAADKYFFFFHHFVHCYVSIWHEYKPFIADYMGQEKLLAKMIDIVEDCLANVQLQTNEDNKDLILDLGKYYYERVVLKAHHFKNLHGEFSILPVLNKQNELKKLREEINDLVTKAIETFNKNLVTFPEVNPRQRLFFATSPVTTKNVPIYKLPARMANHEMGMFLIPNFYSIFKALYYRIAIGLREEKKFAKETMMLADEILGFLQRNEEQFSEFMDSPFVSNLRSIRRQKQNFLDEN